jgi:hypothetical protein
VVLLFVIRTGACIEGIKEVDRRGTHNDLHNSLVGEPLALKAEELDSVLHNLRRDGSPNKVIDLGR